MKEKLFLACIVIIGLCIARNATAQTYIPQFQFQPDQSQQLKIKFYDLSGSAIPTAWQWDFGDATPTSSAQNPIHYYDKGIGTYTVTLTVNWGATQKTIEKTIKVGFAADFKWSQPAYAGRPVYFQDLTVYECYGGQQGYTWKFGINGAESTISAPSFIYAQPGSYTVQFTVVDACGHELSATKQVTVTMPANNLQPEFISATWQVRKNELISFYDRSTPREQIKWWAWWYEQPANLGDEAPVHNNDNTYYYSYRESVSHKFDRAGRFKVRLMIGTTTTVTAGETGPGDDFVYADHVIEVKDLPEPEPIFTDNAYADNMIDYDLSDNTFAGIRSYGRMGFYRKIDPNDPASWAQTDRLVAGGDNLGQFFALSQIRIDNNVALVQCKPDNLNPRYGYSVFSIGNRPASSTSIELTRDWYNKNPSKLLSLSSDKPHFDVRGNEIVVVQREGAVLYLYYLSKSSAGSWDGNVSMTKTAIQTNMTGDSQKIFIDDNAVVTKVGSQIFIFEKVNGTWDFSSKKIINIQSIDPSNDDFGYAGNAVVVTARSPDCPDWKTSSSIAKVYQKPGSGWPAVTTAPPVELYLLKDADISPDTWICLPPDNVGISENYIAIKAVLTNANSVTRRYIYKKINGAWLNMYDTYKINLVDEVLPTVTSNYETVCGFRAMNRVDFYNYDYFCTLYPFTVTSQTLTGLHDSVDKGLIDLGNGPVTFNPGSAISYRGVKIKLEPGVRVKSGSKISFTGVESCDALYYIK